MAKKKSKTQKYKRNVKKKAKKILSQTNQIPKLEIEEISKEQNKTEEINKLPDLKKQEPNKEQNTTKKSPKFNKINIKEKISKIKQSKILKKFQKKNKKSEEIILPKLKEQRKKNIFIRLLYDLKKNNHIIFNSVLILVFIFMLIGLIRINSLEKGTIIYICCIVMFLMAVAISYNKYLSGKIFTLVLCLGMSFAIYQMQYTYDFIRNLNSNVYEYKTYYVVTFDNGVNKSIYNINNKKVGLLKDNCINIERRLNTKLSKVNYIEYDNINSLFNDFYNQEFRAILVNENQYKYLQNNSKSDREVKILYEFKANGKK